MTEQPGDQYKLRLPQGMRDQIAELAKANGRSINAEITIALEQYLKGQTTDGTLRRIYALEARVTALEQNRLSFDLDLTPEEGARIREAREAAGLSQTDLARLAETTQQTIDRIERGVTRRSKAISSILAALEINQ